MIIVVTIMVVVIVATLLPSRLVQAAGSLSVSIVAGYNLVVDSNVESPSSFAPSVATVMGEFCNTGDATLTGVQGFIGDFTGAGSVGGTPGIYPVRNSTDPGFEPATITGSYSFSHVGGAVGTADATRYIGDILPGECKIQYWHFTYPRRGNPSNTGDPVWGASNDPNDDLWLDFDIWGRTGTGALTDATHRMTMRNEISAMANKIYPNGGSWFTSDSASVKPGDIITSNGINYELGNINKGFDNDGDWLPDYNVWLQPIGDPAYDPSCFRLIHSYGKLVVKRSGGLPDSIINFSDRLYFTKLPSDNTGGYGEVHYQFLALNGPCATALTPYQEVASGSDNEKFSADFGTNMPPVGSSDPQITLNKDGSLDSVDPGVPNTYTITVTNNSGSKAGNSEWGVPLVVTEEVSASQDLTTTSAPAGSTILYSTDGGTTWLTTPPADLTTVTHIQYWLGDIEAGETKTITVSMTSDGSTNLAQNCVTASFGNGDPFYDACEGTLVQGSYTIGDTIWKDDNADGIQDGSETGVLENVSLKLYADTNGNGQVDSGEYEVGTVTSNAAGIYAFTNLANGDYVVQVVSGSAGLSGYDATTTTTRAVTINNASVDTVDFGYVQAPNMSLSKSSSPTTVNESENITYTISMTNNRPGATVYCTQDVWSSSVTPTSGQSSWTNNANATGEPDSLPAYSLYNSTADQLILSDFNLPSALSLPGNITSVEAMVYIHNSGSIGSGDDYVTHKAIISGADRSPVTNLTLLTMPTTRTLVTWTVDGPWTNTTDFLSSSPQLSFVTAKVGGKDNGQVNVDAAGFRITTDADCGGGANTIATLPLTDTYDSSRLQFVSASIAPDSTDPPGTLTWNDLGPLASGATTTITVTMKSLSPGASAQDTTNTATVENAQYGDSSTVPTTTATATVTINPGGTIGDKVWFDVNADGVQETGETGIADITVWLYNDTNGNHIYDNGIDTLHSPTATDSSGQYLFSGIAAGNYVTVVDTADADLPVDRYSNHYALSSGSSYQSAVLSDGAMTYLDADFGFAPGAMLGDFVFVDSNRNGTYDIGEPGIPDITATLYIDSNNNGLYDDGNDVLYGSTVTDANGMFLFTSLPPGMYIIVVDKTDPDLPTQTLTCDPDETGKCVSCDGLTAVTVTSDQVNLSRDFGFSSAGALGRYLWIDSDLDGVRDATEPGIANVRMYLYSGDGLTLLNTTTTNSDGEYSFSTTSSGAYLTDDTYQVHVETADLPADIAQSYDPDALLDGKTSVTINGNALVLTANFGYKYQGNFSLSGYVFDDLDSDQIREASGGESGFSAVTLYLYRADGTFMGTVQTNTSGYYSFNNLPAGDYRIIIDETAASLGGLTRTTPAATYYINATITDYNLIELNFGYVNDKASIGDLIFLDANSSGAYDAGEAGISSVEVSLYQDNGTLGVEDAGDVLLAAQMTGSSGGYLFNGLAAGSYYVKVTEGSGALADFSRTYGTTPHFYTLTGGETYLSADFGYYSNTTGNIGDLVWYDVNGNGVIDAGEPGIGGVTVDLYEDADKNGVLDAGEVRLGTRTTNSSGWYQFAGVTAGNDYLVVVTDSSSVLLGSSLTGGSMPHRVQNLIAGTTYPDADFGYDSGDGAIGDTVWRDTDSDGIVDGGESGIADVTLDLYRDANHDGTVDGGDFLLGAATTDASGNYLFNGLVAGNYIVSVTDTNNALSGLNRTNGSGDYAVALSQGAPVYYAADFGFNNEVNAAISGQVIDDANGDGVYDAGETGINTVLITLYPGTVTDCSSPGEAALATTRTSGDGNFLFSSLTPGSYVVCETDPATYSSTNDRDGNNTLNLIAVTLISGVDHTGNNFLDSTAAANASIGDFVWNDLNGDGVQDGGSETGVQNVTVKLYLDNNNDNAIDGGDTDLGEQTTDAAGAYSFTGLVAGNYLVQVTDSNSVLTGYTLTGGSDPHDVSLTAGQVYTTADFGYQQQAASIGDFVWNDLNADGVQDGGSETGIQNVTVKLYLDNNNDNAIDGGDTDLGEQTTDAAGAYSFTGLVAGNYLVQVTDSNSVLNGYTLTGGSDPHDVTLSEGQVYTTADFGYQQQDASIGDFVWNDLNADGVQDGGSETGIQNVTVKLYLDNNNDNAIDGGDTDLGEQTTDAAGAYSFTGLVAGNYLVQITDSNSVLTGYTLTGGSDPHDVTLSEGQVYTTADFGYQQQDASIGDFVWNDLNADGVQDGGSETGIQNVTVKLYLDNNNDNAIDGGDTDLGEQTTDAAGAYSFTGLSAGDYLVQVTDSNSVLTGYALTGGNNPHDVTLSAGQAYTTADFGYQQQDASIGDFIWHDLDGDGVQDGGGETGIQNVTVKLYLDNNNDNAIDGGDTDLGTQTTDVIGTYSFLNLPAGNYLVQVTDSNSVLTGYTLTGGSDPHDVTLSAGQAYTTADFGYQQQAASIGNFVWNDLDGDGVQDGGGETGIQNVSVKLYLDNNNDNAIDGGDTDLGSQVTDAGGAYSFTGLSAGDYLVHVTDTNGVLGGYTLTGGSDPHDVTLSAGENYTAADFGYQGTGTIGNRVWLDLDTDGIQDANEPGIMNVTVTLVWEGLDSTFGTADDHTYPTVDSDTDGIYSFTNLPAGDFRVTLNTAGFPANLLPVYDADGTGTANTSTVSLSSGGINNNQDFGYAGNAAIGDFVWNDADGDGVQDGGEVGLDAITITIRWDGLDGILDNADDANITLDTVNGAYNVTGLPSGDYRVTVDSTDLAAGYSATYDLDGIGTQHTVVETLISGEVNTDVDFGYRWVALLGTVSGQVRRDSDGDGDLTDADSAIAGVTITLDNGSCDPGCPTTVTNAAGNYTFSSVAPGIYTIRETDLAGYTSTGDKDGGTDNQIAITVIAGTDHTGNDFLDTKPAAISGQVRADVDADGNLNDYDSNGDGTTGDTDSGIAGVTISLYHDDNNGNPTGSPLATTTTNDGSDATKPVGYYQFTNVSGGSYVIVESDPADYYSTNDRSGGDDNRIAVTIVSGTDSTDNDFLDTPAVTISGQVRDDTDGDGDLADGETGLAGVWVELVGSNCTRGVDCPKIQTDAGGNYSFKAAPGSYILFESDPAAYFSTGDKDGGADNQIIVNAAAGTGSTANDFLDTTQAIIGGRVIFDRDHDGVFEAGDFGISGVTIELSGVCNSAVPGDCPVTDANGYYWFPAQPSGDYTITEYDLPKYLSSGDKDGGTDNTIALTHTGSASTNNNFLDYSVPTISGTVWYDHNANQAIDSSEYALVNVSVRLYTDPNGDGDSSDGVLVQTLLTDENGFYLFAGIDAGNYVVDIDETTLPGVSSTAIYFLTTNNEPLAISLGAVEDYQNADFGYQRGPISLTKSIVWTSFDGTPDILTDGIYPLAIGEHLKYRITLQFSPGDYAASTIIDTLDKGLAFVSCNPSITADPLISRDDDGDGIYDNGWSSFCNLMPGGTDGNYLQGNPQVLTYPQGSSDPQDVARQVVFDLGAIRVGGTGVVSLSFEYVVGSLDNTIIKSETQLKNTVHWNGHLTQTAPVTIIEPDLQVSLTADRQNVNSGEQVSFTVSIYHTDASEIDAYDFSVAIPIPDELTLVPGSVVVTTECGDPPTITYDPVDNPRTIILTWGQYLHTCGLPSRTLSKPLAMLTRVRLPRPLQQTGSNPVQITYNTTAGAISPGQSISTSVNISWTSLPDTSTSLQWSSLPWGNAGDWTPGVTRQYNSTVGERGYIPGSTIDVYGKNAALILNPPGGVGGGTGLGADGLTGEVNLTGKELPKTGFAPGVITSIPNQPAELVYIDSPFNLEIPALSVNAPILGIPLTDAGWDLSWLNDQVGYLEGTAFLTRSGNTALTAHVYNADGSPGLFVNLYTLKWGDRVILHAWEHEYIYEVREIVQVDGDDLSPLRHEEEPWITLITCRGYDEQNDEYAWRIAVHAVLIEVNGE